MAEDGMAVLEGMEQQGGEEKSLLLHRGDLVLLYTACITEAQNPASDFFGIDRLSEIFATRSSHTPQEIVNTITQELQSFCRSNSFADDVSMVILKAT